MQCQLQLILLNKIADYIQNINVILKKDLNISYTI